MAIQRKRKLEPTLSPEQVAQRIYEREALRKQQTAIRQQRTHSVIHKTLMGVYIFIGLFALLIAYCLITFLRNNY